LILVFENFIEDIPNTLCETSLLLKEHGDACGKQFPASYAFDKHRTSGYLRGTPCFTPDDGSTRIQMVATDRSTMSTAMLQSVRLARTTHGTD
jgi:hypothetical protein